jgi:voltage-gated potassium channel Kch
VVKIGVGVVLGLIKRGTLASALRFSLALSEGSEFSFVLFSAAVGVGVMAQADADMATLAIAISMMAAPILFTASESWVIPRLSARKERAPAYDPIDAPPAPVIICGFGRMGQIVGRVLTMQKMAFTALEKDAGQVEVVRKFGGRVYYGNPTRMEVMRAAGAETAQVLVIALDDQDETLRTAEMAKRYFPNLTILARARNRHHAHLLMDVGIDAVIRETFFSSLKLSEMVMEAMGISQEAAHRTIEIFRAYDERALIEQHAISNDEQQLIQSTQQAAQELMELFEADQEAMPKAAE